MAITYVGTSPLAADNTANSAEPGTVTPVGSMVSGDLIIMVVPVRVGSGLTVTVDVDGGQTWTTQGTQQAATAGHVILSAIYDGTWDANPQFSHSGTSVAWNAIMHVFRPSSGFAFNSTPDNAFAGGNTSITASPQSMSTGEAVAGAASRVVFFTWGGSEDLSTWGSLTGGFTYSGNNQYRVTDGAGLSTSSAYIIQTTSTGTGSPSNTQTGATSGGVNRSRIGFSESAVASGQPYVIRGRGVPGMRIGGASFGQGW